LDTNGVVKTASTTVKEKVPKVVNKTGEIARPLLVKLNLVQGKPSTSRRIGIAVIVMAMLAVSKSLFSPKKTT
jgi:hypothetical protein